MTGWGGVGHLTPYPWEGLGDFGVMVKLEVIKRQNTVLCNVVA